MNYDKYDRVLDVIIFSYMITCNIFLGIFVWDINESIKLQEAGE